jgi:1,2-diacylglycerol 3-alpha-glucosyltransferase
MRLVLSYLSFGPYHLARLGASKALIDGWEIHGVAMARDQSEYAWRQQETDNVHFVSEEVALEQVPPNQWKIGIGRVLDSLAPDVCAIAGYSHPAMLFLILACHERSIPWILMSDSQEIDEPRRPWQEWLKSRIVRLASSGFVAGSSHVEYLCKLGLPSARCTIGYDVVDNDYFATEAARWRGGDGRRSTLSLPYFLASNRFIEKKNLFRLLEAYARYLKSGQLPVGSCQCEEAEPTSHNRDRTTETGQPAARPWNLCMLGDGELKATLLAHCASLGLNVVELAPWESELSAANGQQPTVFFPGFRQIDELPRFYANASAFVHASTTEQWGLVVNEAMASGLPVIVSDRVGCANDLVQIGVNGFTFNPLDVERLEELMLKVSSPSFPLSKYGAESARVISDWGLSRFAAGLFTTATIAMKQGPKRIGVMDGFLINLLIRR